MSEGTELRGRGGGAMCARTNDSAGAASRPSPCSPKMDLWQRWQGFYNLYLKDTQVLKIVDALVSNGVVPLHRQGQKALADTLEAALVVGCSGLPLAARHRSTDGETSER